MPSMHIIACIEDPAVISKLLNHLAEKSRLDSGVPIPNPRARGEKWTELRSNAAGRSAKRWLIVLYASTEPALRYCLFRRTFEVSGNSECPLIRTIESHGPGDFPSSMAVGFAYRPWR